MSRCCIFLVLFLFISFYSFSQLKYEGGDRKDKLKQARELVADYNYTEAIKIYEQLIQNNSEDIELYSEIGYCYLELGKAKKAIKSYKKVVNYYKSEEKMNKTEAKEALYFLAEAYFIAYDFKTAKKKYQELKPYSNKKQQELLDKKISQCDSAKTMFKNPVGYAVMKPDIINSNYPDYCPVVTINNNKLYFTSRRSGTLGNEKDIDGAYFEDIYTVDIQGTNFSEPKNVGIPVNTDGHEATSSISADGKELFIYRSTSKDPGDIYYSKKNDGKWSEPVKMDKPINSRHYETHASLSPDGNYLFFTSNRRQSKGGLDIFMAEKNSKGEWDNVKNLENINTEYDEEGPFVSPDGSTLYFSSKGHIGMGGYDIFKSEKQSDGTWGEPINLGFPLNTSDDEIFFVPTTDPNKAFYSSTQLTNSSAIFLVMIYENLEDMIYVKGYAYDSNADTLQIIENKNDSVKTVNNKWYPKERSLKYGDNDSVYITNVTNNNLIDSVCKVPHNTEIFVYDIDTDNIKGPYLTQRPGGKYGVPIRPIEEKLIYFKAPNHIYDILHVKPEGGVIDYTAELDTIIKGEVKKVRYTEFQPKKTELSDYQKKEFTVLADFLNNNTDLILDVSSYGYNEAPETFDAQRTQLVINFLNEKGVDSSRIKTGLSPNSITGNSLEYTIYDEEEIIVAKDEKDKNQELASVTVTKGTLVTDITFEISQHENEEFIADMNAIAAYLNQNKDAKIGVYGYTDKQGNPTFNKRLAQKRAEYVESYLLEKDVSADQIDAEGRGFSKQISKNKDKDGNYIWASLGYNRRVEIVILDQGSKNKLFVKPVDVPQQYQINTGAVDYKYSVMVVVSEKRLPNTAFDFNVAELLGVDGLYNYIHGEFDTEQEAQDFVYSIKDKFPKAYVFINNFRK